MSSPSEPLEPIPATPGPSQPATPAESTTVTRKEKPKVSPARNAIALVLLVALLIVGGLEVTALFQFNSAVGRLNQALEANEDDLLGQQQVEELLGKQADAPLRRAQTDQQTTYTWRGALRSHALTAFYSFGDNPGLIRYEIGTAVAPEAAE